MRRCVHPSPQIQKSCDSSPASSNGSATSSSTDESVTTIIEAKPKLSLPIQNGPPPNASSQNQLSSSRHRLQHGLDRQIIPTILTDTPTGRPRNCRPICAARKERIPCSCQQCLRAKRLTAKNSSSSTDSVVTTTLKALKSVFNREKRKEFRP
uniref:Uncharacterized protein n=1 Tax=Panagrellus redivivus TaxID=6233 RepID=A0A7E4ZY99_PANRE